MYSKRTSSKKLSSGFTLVELLVVVSIIALLIAILLPSLRKARDSAKQASCMASIRGIAQASLTYAAEDRQENSIPAAATEGDPLFDTNPNRAKLGNYGYGGKSGRGGPPGYSGASSLYGWQKFMGSIHRPLNALMYKGGFKAPTTSGRGLPGMEDTQLDLGLYKCPGDKGYQGNHYEHWRDAEGMTSYDYFGTSYSANVFWTGVVGAGCKMGSNSPYLRPLSRVPHPAKIVLYIENVGRYCWNHHDPASSEYGGPFGDILPDPEYPEGFDGPKWHQNGWWFNVAFADAHASYVKVKSYIPVDPYPTNFTGSCAREGQCKWIMVRGPGWQWDCLPSEPVQTNHPCPAEGRPSQDGEGIKGWYE